MNELDIWNTQIQCPHFAGKQTDGQQYLNLKSYSRIWRDNSSKQYITTFHILSASLKYLGWKEKSNPLSMSWQRKLFVLWDQQLPSKNFKW